jgi:hypothetical protein
LEWKEVQDAIWNDEAKVILGLRAHPKVAEFKWNQIEHWREQICKNYQVPYIKYPWPGKEREPDYVPEESPGNREAIQTTTEQNPVFKRYPYSDMLGRKLDLEGWDRRQQERREKEERELARLREEWQTRQAVELMAQVTGGTAYTRPTGRKQLPTIGLMGQTIGHWLVKVEEDEKHRMETPTERRTRERRQETLRERRSAGVALLQQ